MMSHTWPLRNKADHGALTQMARNFDSGLNLTVFAWLTFLIL
jgi:hypothetical protein